MERARATWTDERLDDLSGRVEDGFNRVDEDLRAMRTELGARLDRVDSRIDAKGGELTTRIDAQTAELSRRIEEQGGELTTRIDAQTAELARRIDALQRTMIQFGGAMTLAILATLVSVVATRA